MSKDDNNNIFIKSDVKSIFQAETKQEKAINKLPQNANFTNPQSNHTTLPITNLQPNHTTLPITNLQPNHTTLPITNNKVLKSILRPSNFSTQQSKNFKSNEGLNKQVEEPHHSVSSTHYCTLRQQTRTSFQQQQLLLHQQQHHQSNIYSNFPAQLKAPYNISNKKINPKPVPKRTSSISHTANKQKLENHQPPPLSHQQFSQTFQTLPRQFYQQAFNNQGLISHNNLQDNNSGVLATAIL